MEPETLLNLYDSYWFNLEILNKKKLTKNKKIPEIPSSNSEIPTLPTIQTKSTSLVCSKISPKKKLSESSSASPKSVLFSPKLQTIFSGKISEDIEGLNSEKEAQENRVTTPKTGISPLKGSLGRRKNKGLSKSLSDLEFEELKGFIDLGFVFSEEDSDSSLATIIPGLQRLKNSSENVRVKENDIRNLSSNNNGIMKNDNVEKCNESSGTISRPYLSEAWEVLEKKNREESLMKWRRVPPPNNQVQMKDYLRCWAHTVASTVR